MPATLIANCPLCGLRFTNRSILELHVREDHVNRKHSQAPGDSATPDGFPARSHDALEPPEDDASGAAT
jgi:hypothetical protein